MKQITLTWTLGDVTTKLRGRMSRERFGRKVGLSRSTLDRLERDDRPSDETVAAVAAGFGLDGDTLRALVPTAVPPRDQPFVARYLDAPVARRRLARRVLEASEADLWLLGRVLSAPSDVRALVEACLALPMRHWPVARRLLLETQRQAAGAEAEAQG